MQFKKKRKKGLLENNKMSANDVKILQGYHTDSDYFIA